MAIDIDELIQKALEYHESIEPVDVDIVLGDRALVARIPYLMPEAFENFVGRYPAEIVDVARGIAFSMEGASRNHPGIVLIDGDDDDDLFVLREKAAHYRWAEVYDALSVEGRQSIQAAVYGLYVYEPQKHAAKVKEAQQHG